MNYHELGRSSLRISEIGFGCMSLGSDHLQNERLINRAIELGINFFDTADLYEKGNNEITVGKALKEKRKEVMLATKVGNEWNADGSGWKWNPHKAYILKAVEESLKRLGTDYIDLYQLHGGTIEDPIDETIEAFELLQQQGKIRYYGISSIRPNVIRAWLAGSRMVSVMMQYSLLDRRPEEEMLELLLQNKTGVLSRGGLAKGLLVDKPAATFLNYREEQVSNAAKAVNNLSGDLRSPAQTALQFVLAHPAITSAVTGIRTAEQLEDAAATSNAPRLKDMELKMLRESLPINYYQEHR
jgi:aryl-alcohol dehydrogenase-like predicted oxidoreductase